MDIAANSIAAGSPNALMDHAVKRQTSAMIVSAHRICCAGNPFYRGRQQHGKRSATLA